MPGNVLEIEDLRKIYPATGGRRESGEIRAVDGVSFHIAQGESLGLVGESGCGKTTLAHCLLRLVEPSGGRVFFMGEDYLGLSSRRLRESRRHIGVVFQDPYSALNPLMKVGDIVQEPLDIHGLGSRPERRHRVGELLAAVGLSPEDAERCPEAFSGGQRQRIAIARALATGPPFVVADEPLSALDAPVQAQIINLLIRLRREFELTLLFISHALPVVRHLCDRVAVMHRGKIVETGPSVEVFRKPNHPYTRQLLGKAG